MIISKNALQVVNVTSPDKQVPILDTVHIREDGGVVAANRDSVILVSPVSNDMKSSFPIPSRDSEEVTISSESIRDVIKYIGSDKRFNGLLEHCDVVKKDDKVEVVCYDGKRTKVLEGKCYPDYFDYKELLRRTKQSSIDVKVILNRKRLKSLIDAIDKVCDDNGDFSPIFLEFTKHGDVLIRSIDPKTGTRVIAVSRALPGVKYIDYSPWESQFIGQPEKKEPVTHVRERFTLTNDYNVVKEEIKMSNEPKTFVRQRKMITEVNPSSHNESVKQVFVRQRTKQKLPGQWHIIEDKCPICQNRLRKNTEGKVSCSYVNCSNFFNILTI